MDSQSTHGMTLGLEQIEVGIVLLRQGLIVSHWSPVMEAWTGRAAVELLGHSLLHTFPAMSTLWSAALRDMLNGGPPVQLAGESPIRHSSGLVPAAAASPLQVGDETVVVLTFLDPRACKTGDANDVPGIRDRLAELGMLDDPAFLAESIEEFISTTNQLLLQLDQGLASADHAAIGKHAHRLAGSALTLGADRLGQLAMALETHASEPVTALQRRIAALRMEAQRVENSCRKLIA